ncbi:MAG TPA: hypothetical protein VGK87_01360, partial [Anaerolineae bacterium]
MPTESTGNKAAVAPMTYAEGSLQHQAAQVLAARTVGTKIPEPNRLDVWIRATDLLECVKALAEANWGYLIAITALDYLGKPAAYAQDPRWK